VATSLALWFAIQQRVYKTRVHDIDELRQRLTAFLARLGAVACVLVFVPVVDILNKLCDYQFVFSVPYLMDFIFNTMLVAACNILKSA